MHTKKIFRTFTAALAAEACPTRAYGAYLNDQAPLFRAGINALTN